jgi:hypothetical protein
MGVQRKVDGFEFGLGRQMTGFEDRLKVVVRKGKKKTRMTPSFVVEKLSA